MHNEIDAWVRRFGFGKGLAINELSKDLFSIVVETEAGRKDNLADVGFGISQVLPLIVQAIAAPEESLTIAEQPEIHLNPKLQGVLAELFVEMANADHRVVVETHSEHLLLRLRTLVAQGEIDSRKVAIYFVEKKGEHSTIRHIPLEANGHVQPAEWPDGFFGDTLQESLALASSQAKRKEGQDSENG